MGYSAEVVKKVRADFEKKRDNAVNVAALHRNEVAMKCPNILEIEKALSMTGLSLYKAALMGPDGLEERIEKIKHENLVLNEGKRDLLINAGFPEDYLDVKFSCDKCNDAGYVGTGMCSCMKKALVNEAYNHSGLGKFLKHQTFKNFDLSYYENEDDRLQMESILEKAKKYVSDFGKPEKDSNLLFVGTTGLGKTHITTAIAKGIIDKAYDVVYDSAQNIIRAFENERFEKDERAEVETRRYFDCDLLIIDDLGSEFSTQLTVSALYNIVNCRGLEEKPTIISTNLVPDELKNTYSDRIASRILSAYTILQFDGADIRQLKTL